MFKPTMKRSTTSRRVRVARSVATSHADTAGGPRPIVSRPNAAVTEQGPSLPRVRSPEQSTEPPPKRVARSHSQDRDVRMSTSNGQHSSAGAFVGIDVAQDKLDLAPDEGGNVTTFTNDPEGIVAILRMLRPLKPQMIVVESTGGLERPLLEALLENDLPAALVHPGRVRYFAKGLGILSKTDRIDARVLRRFGQLAGPRLAEKRSKNEAELQSLVTCRRQLNVTRVQQKNRRVATSSKAALRSIDKVVETLDKQIGLLDKQICELIDADDEFKHLDKLLQSVP